MPGTPTPSVTIFATHARIAEVFTSTTGTSAQWGWTRLPHALFRVAVVFAEM